MLCLAFTSVTTYLLYAKTEQLFRWSVDERMLSVASVASTKFDPDELDKIQGSESVDSDVYRKTVLELQRIRRHTRKLKYIYIMRKTDDSNTLEFVADADSLQPDVPEDINGDGEIDDTDEKTYPGDPYDISEFPEFKKDAFVQPFVDPDLIVDPWGTLLSGTSPIENDDKPEESVRYVIGLDLDVTQYQQLKNLALIPFVIFVGFLLSVITLLMFVVKHMWKKQVIQLKEIDKQKDMLISLVSHQLKSPLASLRWGFNDLMDGEFGSLTDQQKEHIRNESKITDNLLELVSLLLDASRIEMGKLQMNKQKQSLTEFFKEIITVIEEMAKEKGVQFTYSLPPSLSEGAFDKRLTHMTIENLLTNAIKYSPKGSVELKVDLRDNILRCSVKDTGMGIPKDDQEKLFGKMFRAGNVGKIEGTGLGLYVAKGAIEQQGGKLWFESEVGKGTVFYVELPIS